jgi:hypothetical protein
MMVGLPPMNKFSQSAFCKVSPESLLSAPRIFGGFINANRLSLSIGIDVKRQGK